MKMVKVNSEDVAADGRMLLDYLREAGYVPARIAVDYTVECIAWTKEAGTDIRYGVNFERYLGDYSRKLGL